MQKLAIFTFLLIVSGSAFSQTGKTTAKTPVKAPVKAPVKTVAPQAPMKTLNDSASYAIGMSIASFCKQQGITQMNTALTNKACSDVLADKPALMTEQLSNEIINKLLMRGKVAPPKTVKPVNRVATIKSSNDSVSYAIAMNHAVFFKQQGITSLNMVLMTSAIKDLLGNKTLRFDDRTANGVMNKVITELQLDKVKPAIDAGNIFLEENKKKAGVKVTPSGLQYEVITEGTGIKPTRADTFVAHYRGTLLDGKEFDASYNRGQPLVYPLTQVIPGWTEGLQLMPVGSKYKFYVPYNLAYGVFGTPDGNIPGGSVLIFELELLDVKKSSASAPTKPAN